MRLYPGAAPSSGKNAYRNIGIKVYVLTATLSFFDHKSQRGVKYANSNSTKDHEKETRRLTQTFSTGFDSPPDTCLCCVLFSSFKQATKLVYFLR